MIITGSLFAVSRLLLAVAKGTSSPYFRNQDLFATSTAPITDVHAHGSAFTAATLLIFCGAERLSNFDIDESLSKAQGRTSLAGSPLGHDTRLWRGCCSDPSDTDGDALFPAIALNPKAAVMATLYSSILALIVAYAFFVLAPGFMN
ncbi:putative manganese transporter [Aliiroseovarius sp. Z3]|uniref:putative manganese transporter n=1 Tax=Aliiroseovarius sp. Z3 TaxID=2811402 RepID=UPI0023B2E9E7|nr:putative manganese transporter [Aliiroseovarius sp. Z3]